LAPVAAVGAGTGVAADAFAVETLAGVLSMVLLIDFVA